MNSSKVLKKSDLMSDEYKERYETLKSKHLSVFNRLDDLIDSLNGGIRENMFITLCDNAYRFSDSLSDEDIGNIVEVAVDQNIEPEWLEWYIGISENLNDDLPLIDVAMVMGHCYETGMSLSEFSKAYDKCQDTPEQFINLLENDFSFVDSDELDEDRMNISDNSTDSEHITAYQPDSEDVITDKEKKSASSGVEAELSDVFSELLSVMSDSHTFDRSKLQEEVENHLSALSSLFTEIFHAWNIQKNEMERLEGVYKLQTRLMGYQKRKMNEQANEIAHLRNQLNQANETYKKSQEVKHKLSEIQNLMAFDNERIGMD